jgi:hypothetical protein
MVGIYAACKSDNVIPTAISNSLISILAGARGSGGAPDRYRAPVGVVNSAVCL